MRIFNVFFLLSVTAMLSIVAIVYGRNFAPNTASATGLGWCNAVPCYRNLVPGQTLWTAQMTAYPDLSAQPDVAYRPSLLPSFDQRWLGTIILLLSPDTTLTAGDIVQLYGVPCRVDIYFNGKRAQFTLAYPRISAQLDAEAERLKMDTRIHYLFLRSPTSYPPHSASDPCTRDGSVTALVLAGTVHRAWRGFTTVQRYLHDQ